MPTAHQADNEPTTVSVARLYDYLLGGKHNYAVDRAGAERLKSLFPEIEDWAWCNRGFHQRAAYWLAAKAGIRQFIDIGSGLPTQVNTHEVVQSAVADVEEDGTARVVYVDMDAEVVDLSRQILGDTETTTFFTGDLLRPEELLNHPELKSMIDFSEPVGLLTTAVVHFIPDDLDPWGLIRRCVAPLAPGSYLVLSQATDDKMNPETVKRMVDVYKNANGKVHPRSWPDVERFFDGLEMVPPYPGAKPAMTFGGLWGAEDPELADDDGSRALYAGVGRKPG